MLQFISDFISETTGIPVAAPTPFCASSINPKNWGTSLRSASYASREDSNAKDMAYEILSRDRSPIADLLLEINDISYVPAKGAAMLNLLAHLADIHTIEELKKLDPKPLGRGIAKNTPRGTNYQYLHHNGYTDLSSMVNMTIDDVTDAWGILIDLKKKYGIDTQRCEDWYRSLHGKIVDIVMPTMFDDAYDVAAAFANVARQLAEIDEIAKIFTENHKIPVEAVTPAPAPKAIEPTPVIAATVPAETAAAMSQNLTQVNPSSGDNSIDLDEAFYEKAFEEVKLVIDLVGAKSVDELVAWQPPESFMSSLNALTLIRPDMLKPIVDAELTKQLGEMYPKEESFEDRMHACMNDSKALLAGYKKMGIKNINVLEDIIGDMSTMAFTDIVVKYMTAEYLDIIVQMYKDIALDNGILPMVKKYLDQKATPAEVVTSAPATPIESSAAMPQFEATVVEDVKPSKPPFTQGGKAAVKPLQPSVALESIPYNPSLFTDSGSGEAFKAFPWIEDVVKTAASCGVAVQFALIPEPGYDDRLGLVEFYGYVKGVFDYSRSFTVDLGKVCSRDLTAWANFTQEGTKLCLEDAPFNFKLAAPARNGQYAISIDVLQKIFTNTVSGFNLDELKTIRNYGENAISANRTIAYITIPRNPSKNARKAFIDFAIRGAEGLRLQQVFCRFIVESYDPNTLEMIISNKGVPMRYNTPAPEMGSYPILRFKLSYRKDENGKYVDTKRGDRMVHIVDLDYLDPVVDANVVSTVDNTGEFTAPTAKAKTAEKQAG